MDHMTNVIKLITNLIIFNVIFLIFWSNFGTISHWVITHTEGETEIHGLIKFFMLIFIFIPFCFLLGIVLFKTINNIIDKIFA